MAEPRRPSVWSIAAHRGFADALVAGLVPRYSEPGFGLARLTLLLPSARAARTISEAFTRHAGDHGTAGLLLPRMVLVGDLDLDEALGPLFDSLGAGAAIPPAADPVRRWLRLAQLIGEVCGGDAPGAAARLRLAFEHGRAMDRLLAEEVAPGDLLQPRVLDLVGDLAEHWRGSLHLFAEVQARWQFELAERGEVDAAERRNRLFREAARRLRANPPPYPYVAAGVTSAAPALAALLRAVADLPDGAVVLPDCDLTMTPEVWEELGSAGDPAAETPFGRGDAVTHPQYHLKLLLNRMGLARGEVRPWHRSGPAAAPPQRSRAISSLFQPPEASKGWALLKPDRRKLPGVRLLKCANPEEEAQAIALLVREAVAVPERRVAVVTPDRALAGRVVQHLARWNIAADDSAGRPLSQTAAGRVLLLLAEVAAEDAAPVPLLGLLGHPLMAAGEGRAEWLRGVRALDLALRGPRRATGLAALAAVTETAHIAGWWAGVAPLLAPLLEVGEAPGLAVWLDRLATAGEAMCGEGLWAREDGRALATFVEELRLQARMVELHLPPQELPRALRDAMDRVAVRPSYGGHPRVAIYGLLEARMTPADLVICAGLNEGVWPPATAPDPLLPPAVLRALGVPGAEFRIGLSAHDLAGLLGAPQVVLSRARRDAGGPAIASRFVLRVRALLGELAAAQEEHEILTLAQELDPAPMEIPPYPRPAPMPGAEQRRVSLSVTSLDRLRSDPFQFYASRILRLPELEALDGDPGPAWQGTLAHAILEDWHKGGGTLAELADRHLASLGAHPLLRALWQPRLLRALEWVALRLAEDPARQPVLVEGWGEMHVRGIRIHGKADRIDALADGGLAIVDYKTGGPPSGTQVKAGYALQLGTLGLIAAAGGFAQLAGEPQVFEYWSLGRSKDSETGFGYAKTPLKFDRKTIAAEDFLASTQVHLHDALDRWILGTDPFTARLNPDAKGYATYDQLMRLAEWLGREESGT